MNPTDENGKLIYSTVDYVDTWKAMEACVRSGLVRSIGVSNFNSQQLQRVLDICTIKPVTNQVGLASIQIICTDCVYSFAFVRIRLNATRF